MKKIIFFAAILAEGIFFTQNAMALTISPPIFEIGANPGDNPTQSIKLLNETNSLITVYASTANFTANDSEEGAPKFLENRYDENTLAQWIEIDQNPIEILPGEQKLVPFTIHVPDNADPGGHYAAVFFGNQPPTAQGGSVGLSGKLGTLILLTVSGDVVEQGRIVSFNLTNPRSFYEYLPISFTALFENTGNVHLMPQGEIIITNMFGRVADRIPFNEAPVGGGKNVLPNTSRHLETVWTKGPLEIKTENFIDIVSAEFNNFALGRYTAVLNLHYGSSNQTASANTTFWIIPWQLILVCLAGALIAITIIILLVRAYNGWIIKQAMKKINSK